MLDQQHFWMNQWFRVKQGLHRGRVLACILLAFTAAPAQAQQVWVGSGNGWDAMIAHPDQWRFVRSHANGFYANFIQLLHATPQRCAQISALFTHKDAYFESDSRYTGLGGFPDGGQFSRALQSQELFDLLKGGFIVPYSSLNYGVDDAKLADLRSLGLPAGQSRPCFAQSGPWTFGGDLQSPAATQIRKNIASADGASTDGPMSLWQANQGKMQQGSFEIVQYAHSLHKTAAVMVAPYNLQPLSQWLGVAQQCVRQHEDAGAIPDIWIVFEYATSTPTLPESVNGRPADTITGMADWLITHVTDPQHWARIVPPASATMDVPAGQDKSHVLTFTVRNKSTWMDLCPSLFAKINDPHHLWRVRFHVNGQDVTHQIMQEGLPFVGPLRLWPGRAHTVQVLLACQHKNAPPASIQLSLRPSPSDQSPVYQTLTLHARAAR